MPLKEDSLNSQLTLAQKQLKNVEGSLEGATPKKHPMWRRANARVKQIEGRLASRTATTNVSATDASAAGDESEE